MALRDAARGLLFGRDPGQQTEDLVGHTPPAPDPSKLVPKIGATPIGQSGRANFYGLPQWDEINPKLIGTRGLRLMDEMYRTDAHIRRLILAAWSPVVAGSWTLEPYGGEEATQKDRDIAEAIWWLLTEWMSPNWYEHLLTLGPVLLRFGFAPFEHVNWQTCEYNGKTLLAPKKLDVRMPWSVWRWWQDDFGELTHIGQQLPSRPDTIIPVTDLVYYRLAAEGDNWMGTSLLRHAYKHWYLKDKFERLDAVGQERRAVGVPVVYHSPDIDPEVLNGVEAALAQMHMSEVAYMLIPGWKMGIAPEGADPRNMWFVDVVQYDSSSGPGIQASIDYHQQGISASFLTDFLELGHHQVGARATAEVQEDPFLTAINGALLPPVIPPANRFIDLLRKKNWDSDGSPQLKLTLTDQASLSEIATYVQLLVSESAMQVDDDLEDWLRNYAGLPAANAQAREQRQKVQQAAMENAASAADGTAADTQPTGQGDGQNPPRNPASPAPAGDRQPAQTDKQLERDASPVAAGVIVHATDTGRVLVVRRSADDTDAPDVFAGWEFPGGKLDPDDRSPWIGAVREFTEETGAKLPAGRQQLGQVPSPDGRYLAFVVQIPHETDINLARSDRLEVADTDWRPATSLASGTLSDRAKLLVPGLMRILDPDNDGDDDLSRAGDTDRDARQLAADPAPDAKWFERLLSQDRLREAFDGARDHVEQACAGPALTVARAMAHQAANGNPASRIEPPPALVDALTGHYEQLYHLGRETVADELGRQAAALHRTLDDPAGQLGPAAALGSRLARARQRGQHSARNIIAKINERLGRDHITGLKDPAELQKGAEQAATGQLRVEALANTAASINDGRADEAQARPDVIGAYYTSVMDDRSCDPCVQADDGQLLSPTDAVTLGPPNPLCDGRDFCRCALVWVLSSDPAALAATT